MKILIILEQFTDNDTNKALFNDVLFLRQQGFDVRMATLFSEVPEKTLYQESFFSKSTFSCFGMNHLWNFSVWRKVTEYISQEKPDLVLLGEGNAKIVGIVAARFAHTTNIFVFSHDAENIESSKSFFGDIFYSFTHAIIVSSESAKEKLFLRGAASSSKIFVIPDGFPSNLYGKRSERDIRKSLGISSSEFIFLFLGELILEKGVDVLLRAFSKVLQGRLLIVGDGPEKKNLESLSKGLGFGEKVLFLSSYFDVPGLVMEAGVMVFPSKNKESVSSFFPAFFSGIPVIATDFSGVEEIIQNGNNGIVVRKQDSEDLASAMNLIVSDSETRVILQKNAKKGLEKFSISTHCAKILSLMKQENKKQQK